MTRLRSTRKSTGKLKYKNEQDGSNGCPAHFVSRYFFKLLLIIDSKDFHRLDDRAQAVGQNLLADTVKAFAQLIETPRSDKQITQYQQLPLNSDQADGCCDGIK